MFNVGPLELIVVLVIALIVLGPQRLPDVAKSLGRGMREFRSALDRPDDEEYEDDEPGVHDDLAESSPPPAAASTAEAAPTETGAETAPADYQNAAESSESSSSSSGRV